MLFPGFPNPDNASDVQVFVGQGTNSGLVWQTWKRPTGKGMCFIHCRSSGGGGGGGFTRASSTAGGGGGGGGSASFTNWIGPTGFLPDVLYINPQRGGIGGTGSGVAGATGGASTVNVAPNIAATNVLVSSGNSGGGGGGAGTVGGAGAGGAAGAAASIGAMPLGNIGMFAFVAGLIGTAGGAAAGGAGGAQTIPTTGPILLGGTGGGGTTSADFAGGLITAIANSYISEIRPENAAAGSNNGSGGFWSRKPSYAFCGMGGGASDTLVGGAGGSASQSYGAGGGGGGAGTTGGAGGAGGDGLVIIICW